MAKKPKSLVQKKMLEARQHIKAKEYQEAQAILERIDHPTAKQWLQKIHKTWFEDTAKLVKAGKLEEALEILHNINHPKATKWIAATEKKMLDVDPFAEEPEEDEDPHHPEVKRPLNQRKAQSTPNVTIDDYFEKRERVRSAKKQQQSKTPAWVWGVLATVTLAAIIAIAAVMYEAPLTDEQRSDAEGSLNAICVVYWDASDEVCYRIVDEWMDEHGKEIWECQHKYLDPYGDRWVDEQHLANFIECIDPIVAED
jgi:hypothetical protein